MLRLLRAGDFHFNAAIRLQTQDGGAITEIEQALKTLGEDLWSPDRKSSEQVLPQILKRYRDKVQDIRVPENGSYYTLIEHQHPDDIAPEVISVLDSIQDVASRAKSHDHP